MHADTRTNRCINTTIVCSIFRRTILRFSVRDRGATAFLPDMDNLWTLFITITYVYRWRVRNLDSHLEHTCILIKSGKLANREESTRGGNSGVSFPVA